MKNILRRPSASPFLRLTSQTAADFAAQCLDCNESHAGRNAAAWAHEHARLTDHKVALSFGYVVSTIAADEE